jgi:hypothetical protein
MKKRPKPNKETRQGRAAEKSARIDRAVQRLMQSALAEAARITRRVSPERLAHIVSLLSMPLARLRDRQRD